jgi:choline dehydrogenase-like flavoprotein
VPKARQLCTTRQTTRKATSACSPGCRRSRTTSALKFGTDPTTSGLDTNCKVHDVDNLYVVDGSFFCSSAAVNPALTIIANALRVGEHIAQRLK